MFGVFKINNGWTWSHQRCIPLFMDERVCSFQCCLTSLGLNLTKQALSSFARFVNSKQFHNTTFVWTNTVLNKNVSTTMLVLISDLNSCSVVCVESFIRGKSLNKQLINNNAASSNIRWFLSPITLSRTHFQTSLVLSVTCFNTIPPPSPPLSCPCCMWHNLWEKEYTRRLIGSDIFLSATPWAFLSEVLLLAETKSCFLSPPRTSSFTTLTHNRASHQRAATNVCTHELAHVCTPVSGVVKRFNDLLASRN